MPESPAFAFVDTPSGSSVWALQGGLRERLFEVPADRNAPKDFNVLLGGRRDRLVLVLVLVLGRRGRAGRALPWDGQRITAMPDPLGLGTRAVRWQVSDDGSVLAIGLPQDALDGAPRLAYLPAGESDWRYVALPGGYAVTAADSSESTGLIVAGSRGGRSARYARSAARTLVGDGIHRALAAVHAVPVAFRQATGVARKPNRSALRTVEPLVPGAIPRCRVGCGGHGLLRIRSRSAHSGETFVACDLIAGRGSQAGGGDTAFVTCGGRLYWVEKGGARWRTRDLRGAPDEQTVVPAIDSAAPNFTEPYPMSEESAV